MTLQVCASFCKLLQVLAAFLFNFVAIEHLFYYILHVQSADVRFTGISFHLHHYAEVTRTQKDGHRCPKSCNNYDI